MSKIELTADEVDELVRAHRSAAIAKAQAGQDASYHEQRADQLAAILAGGDHPAKELLVELDGEK